MVTSSFFFSFFPLIFIVNYVYVCIAFAMWDLQGNYNVWHDEVTVAIVAIKC